MPVPIFSRTIAAGRGWHARHSPPAPGALPSQNCAGLYAALKTVGEFRVPVLPPAPFETGLPSLKTKFGLWQVAQPAAGLLQPGLPARIAGGGERHYL